MISNLSTNPIEKYTQKILYFMIYIKSEILYLKSINSLVVQSYYRYVSSKNVFNKKRHINVEQSYPTSIGIFVPP